MELPNIDNNQQSRAQTQNRTPAITSDYRTFLKMMTVQIQHQDPLNPMDPSDFSVQLATFSGVEQQVQTNGYLDQILGRLASIQFAQLSNIIGKEVMVSGNVNYQGSSIVVYPADTDKSDQMFLVVRNTAGRLISRELIPSGHDAYRWHGIDSTGNYLPNGEYSLHIESWRDDSFVQEEPASYYARVIQAKGEAAGYSLSLDTGAEVLISDIMAIRN